MIGKITFLIPPFFNILCERRLIDMKKRLLTPLLCLLLLFTLMLTPALASASAASDGNSSMMGCGVRLAKMTQRAKVSRNSGRASFRLMANSSGYCYVNSIAVGGGKSKLQSGNIPVTDCKKERGVSPLFAIFTG